MKKTPWLAHPWLSALLAVSWLLLQHTLAPVHLLSAVLIGLIVPRLLHQLLPPAPTIRMLPALRLRKSEEHRGHSKLRGVPPPFPPKRSTPLQPPHGVCNKPLPHQ